MDPIPEDRTTANPSASANPDPNARADTFRGYKLRQIDRRILIGAFVVALIVSAIIVVAVYVVDHCHREPAVELEEAIINRMDVYPIQLAPDAESWFLLASDVTLTLSIRNRNDLVGCSTTPRELKVSIYYADNSGTLVSQIPLDIPLKPKKSFVLTALLNMGSTRMINYSAGAALAEDLRNVNRTIPLQMKVDIRYLIADRNSFWTHLSCGMVAVTPLNSTLYPDPVLDLSCIQFLKRQS